MEGFLPAFGGFVEAIAQVIFAKLQNEFAAFERGIIQEHRNETHETLEVDAEAVKADYLEEVEKFRAVYKADCVRARIDYVPLHTGMPFDKALMSYLLTRQARA